MDRKVRIIELKENVLARNDKEAEKLKEEMRKNKTLLLNLMSSPGSGKTTLLKRTISVLKDKYNIAVLEADIDSSVDAKAILDAGADSLQLHTGGCCHLTADMTRQGLEGLDKHYDLIVIENVGNLVCPAEFDTGANINVCLLSVPEGDDKPLKYPLMFKVCNCVVITKLDVSSYFDFDLEKCKKNAKLRNPDINIIALSAKSGENFDEWIKYLTAEIDKIRESE